MSSQHQLAQQRFDEALTQLTKNDIKNGLNLMIQGLMNLSEQVEDLRSQIAELKASDH